MDPCILFGSVPGRPCLLRFLFARATQGAPLSHLVFFCPPERTVGRRLCRPGTVAFAVYVANTARGYEAMPSWRFIELD
jgi:hypothetical protein